MPSLLGQLAWTLPFYLQTHSSAAVDKIRQREKLLRNKIKDFSTCHGRIYSAH
jgi:hypothetical protein